MTRYLSFLCLAASLFCFTGCDGGGTASAPVIDGEMTAEEVAEMATEEAINDPKAMQDAIKSGKDPYAPK